MFSILELKHKLAWKGNGVQSRLKIEDDRARNVLETISKYKGLPFLELADVTGLDEPSLHEAIKQLESLSLVEVSKRGDVLNEYVSLRPNAIAAGA
jgi:predicted transcriptional regulator